MAHITTLKCSVYIQLSLNGHLYKTDASLRRTPGVGPVPDVFQSFYCNWTPYKTDTSLKRKVGASPDSVRFRESWLYTNYPMAVHKFNSTLSNLLMQSELFHHLFFSCRQQNHSFCSLPSPPQFLATLFLHWPEVHTCQRAALTSLQSSNEINSPVYIAVEPFKVIALYCIVHPYCTESYT